MNVFHYACVFSGHQAWVFIVAIRQGLDKVMFSRMYHHYVRKKPGKSRLFKLNQVVHKSWGQHKHKHRISAYQQALLPPLELLHHKRKVVKHSFLKAGTFALNHCRLLPCDQKKCAPHSACVHVFLSCIHMCAYTTENDCANVCIYVWAWSRLCAQTRKCRHDCAYM